MSQKILGVAATGVSDAIRKSELDAAVAVTRRRAIALENDFFNTPGLNSEPFNSSAFAAGTAVGVTSVAAHPGIMAFRDSTTANGGWHLRTPVNSILVGGGERFVCTFQIKTARTTSNGWIGLGDHNANAQPADGVMLYWIGNGAGGATLSGRNSNNSVQSITGSTHTLAIDSWATVVIEVNAAATLVTYTLFSDAGGVLWVSTLAANIPTAVGRETGVSVLACDSSVDAGVDMLWLDYLRFEINRVLVR